MDETTARMRLQSPVIGAMAHALAVMLPLLRAQGGVMRHHDIDAPRHDGESQTLVQTRVDPPGSSAPWHRLPSVMTALVEALHAPPSGVVFRLIGLPEGCLDAAGLRLVIDDRCSCLIALARLDGHPPFTSEDLDLLQRTEAPLLRVMHEALRRSAGAGREGWSAARTPVSADQLVARLSATERSVLRHLLSPLTEKQIGNQLGRSPHTVHVHVKNIYRKLDVGSRRQLRDIARAVRLDPLALDAGGDERTSRDGDGALSASAPASS